MALDAVAPGAVEAKVLDLPEITYGRANEWLKKAYLATINRAPAVWEKIYGAIDSSTALEGLLGAFAPLRRAMEAVLEEEKPDAVVCTFPLYPCLIAEIYRNRPRPFPLVTVITDSITINAIWYRCRSDGFVVANAETEAVLRAAGIAPETIHPLGFPVSPRYAGLAGLKPPPGAGEPWRVLYVANGGKQEEALGMARALASLQGKGVALKVAAGRDPRWQARMRAAVEEGAPAGSRPEVLGWTDRMPELMAGAHLLVGKAGGATVQEALAAGTPMLMTKVIPGQEEGNARLLLENGCGMLAESPEEAVAAVESAFAVGGVLWAKWRANVERLSRPGAAEAIARFVLGLAEERRA